MFVDFKLKNVCTSALLAMLHLRQYKFMPTLFLTRGRPNNVHHANEILKFDGVIFLLYEWWITD